MRAQIKFLKMGFSTRVKILAGYSSTQGFYVNFKMISGPSVYTTALSTNYLFEFGNCTRAGVLNLGYLSPNGYAKSSRV